MNIEITNDFRVLIDGSDAGLVPDVLCNYVSAIDPAAPAESVVFRVAHAARDAHLSICAQYEQAMQAMAAQYEQQLQNMAAELDQAKSAQNAEG